MQRVFSEKLDIKLIRLVKEHTVLYDYNDPKYMDFNAREVAWQKIGDALEKPAADCKVRWINIRDVHRRILRKSISGSVRPKRPYKYDRHLEFMKNFYKEVVSADVDEEYDNDDGDKASESNTSTVWSDVVIEYDDEVSSEDGETKPLKKRKSVTKPSSKLDNFEEVQLPASSLNDSAQDFDVKDPVDAFVISILPTLRRLTPYRLNIAKSKIFQIVQELELQEIVEHQSNRSDSIAISTESPVYFQG